jgi:hypothetical protein
MLSSENDMQDFLRRVSPIRAQLEHVVLPHAVQRRHMFDEQTDHIRLALLMGDRVELATALGVRLA